MMPKDGRFCHWGFESGDTHLEFLVIPVLRPERSSQDQSLHFQRGVKALRLDAKSIENGLADRNTGAFELDDHIVIQPHDSETKLPALQTDTVRTEGS